MSRTPVNGLSKFGKLVIEYVYDELIADFKALSSGSKKWGIGKEYTDVFNKLSDVDKNTLQKYIETRASTAVFGFLQIFEEHREFKLVYEHKGQRVDLCEESEMLKSEHHGENGWIARFSKETT